MVRKMAYVGFSYLLGLFFASFFSFGTSVAICTAAVLLSIVIIKLKGKDKIVFFVCSICFAIGVFYYFGYDNICYQKITAYDGKEVTVSGVLTDYTDYNSDRTVYYIDGYINGIQKAEIYCYAESKTSYIGDEITVVGIGAVPNNSFLFNSQSYYKAKGIYLTVNNPEISINPANKLPIKRALHNYRNYIHDKMIGHLDKESLALVDAIMFGDKSGIDNDTKTVLYRAGIGHIMAVSGVHLSIICSLFWFVLSFSDLRKITRFILILFPMLIFVMLSGASSSVVRAAIMLVIVYGATLLNRRSDTMNSLGIAVILLTADCPFSVRDASFLLSVSGVIGIAAIAPEIIRIIEEKRKIGKITKSLITSAVVSATLFPVSFMFFNEISIVSPISNLLLIPLCSVILICGVITVFTLGFVVSPIMKICHICCRIVIRLSYFFGGFHFSYVSVSNRFSYFAIIAVIAVSIGTAVYFRKVRLTALIYTVACFVCILCIELYRFIPSDHINVAVLRNSRSSAIVIDDGKTASVIDLKKGGLCADNVFAYLQKNGIYRIELIGLLVDSQASIVTYQGRTELYDVGYYFLPKSNEKYVDSFINSDILVTYDEDKTAVIEMPNYTMYIADNNTILFDVNGCEILAYDGRDDVNASGEFDIIVEYAGRKPNESVDGDVEIYCDPLTETFTDKNTDVYFGENVIIKISKDGFETEVLSCGSCY